MASRPFLQSINHFRGLAIIFVVVAHYSPLASWSTDLSAPERFAKSLLGNGTVLFAWIAGYLFHHIFCSRPLVYSTFIRKKISVVIYPYLAMSLLPLLWTLFISHEYQLINGNEGGGMFSTALHLLFFGKAYYPYWYIPMVMLHYLLAPLDLRFISLKYAWVFALTAVTAVGFIHRPVDNLNILQALIYFTPVYAIGALCSRDSAAILTVLRRPFIIPALFVLILISAVVQTLYYQQPGTMHQPLTDYLPYDINLWQKLLLCLGAWGILDRYEERRFASLQLFATYSFPLYFIHPYIVYSLAAGCDAMGFTQRQGPHYALLAFVVVFALSTLTAIALKKLLGRYSRTIIGG